MPAISPKRKSKLPLSHRTRIPGRVMVSKLVRFYPEELERIERAANAMQPPIGSSRLISEAAIERAAKILRVLAD